MRKPSALQLVLGALAAVLVPVALTSSIWPLRKLAVDSNLKLDDLSDATSVSVSFLPADRNRVLKQSQPARNWFGALLGTSKNASKKPAPPGMGARATRLSNSSYRAAVPLEQLPKQHQSGIYEYAHQHGDLSPLREDRSPDSDTWDNGIAICACMLQENATDIREWLLYHRCEPVCCALLVWLAVFGSVVLLRCNKVRCLTSCSS